MSTNPLMPIAGRIKYTENESYETGSLGKKVKDVDTNKVDKVTGKGLSTEDFTGAFKTKLEGVSDNAKNVSVSASGSATDEVNYITIDGTEKKLAGGSVDSVNGQTGTVVLDGDDIAYDNNLSINDKLDAKYEKPSSGIPYSDMSEAVQASLDNADSAAQDIEDIEEKIPAQATSENKLADKAFVNSSIATNTAYFRGTYNSVAELEAYSGEKTNNDYAFVISTDSSGNTVYNRYKWNGTAWVFEYALNNSSFTAAQWAAISSAITAAKVTSYDSHLNNLVTSVSSSSTDEEYPSAKCVYDLIGDVSTAIASINALIGGASE